MFDMRSRKKKILLQLILLLMTIPYAVPLVQMVLGSLGGIGLGNYKAVWDTGVVPVFFRNSAMQLELGAAWDALWDGFESFDRRFGAGSLYIAINY